MGRPPLYGKAMTTTERTRRHRARVQQERAEQDRIARKYFRVDHPLSASERREFAREQGIADLEINGCKRAQQI
jgi:hypothetical protein